VGGITPAELAAVWERLEAFADDVFASLPRKGSACPWGVLSAGG
jgi:hypothetical protein